MSPTENQGSLRQGSLGRCRPLEKRTGHFAKEHRLLKKNHCACVWCGRRGVVLCLPALYLVPFGGLHMMGVIGAWWWQNEGTALLVVRSLAANAIRERPTGYWSHNSAPIQTKRKCSKRVQHRWGCVITLVNALKLLVTQQKKMVIG